MREPTTEPIQDFIHGLFGVSGEACRIDYHHNAIRSVEDREHRLEEREEAQAVSPQLRIAEIEEEDSSATHDEVFAPHGRLVPVLDLRIE